VSIETEKQSSPLVGIPDEIDSEMSNELIYLASRLGRFSVEELSNRTNIQREILSNWCNTPFETGGIERVGGKWMIKESFEKRNPFFLCCKKNKTQECYNTMGLYFPYF